MFLRFLNRLQTCLVRPVLSCAVICRTKISRFGNLVPKNAMTQKGLETCSLLSTCCQTHPINDYNQEINHVHKLTKRDSNLGLSMSHIVNYEAAALTTQPPRLDPSFLLWFVRTYSTRISIFHDHFNFSNKGLRIRIRIRKIYFSS